MVGNNFSGELPQPSLEQLRPDHVAEVKKRLAALGEPQRITIKPGEVPNCTAGGYYGVELDPRTLPIIAQSCGVTPRQQEKLKLTFRSAELADRDFFGGATGGLTLADQVEIYTSVPVDYLTPPDDQNIRSFRRTHVPLNKSQVVDSFLHEMRHFVQQQMGVDLNPSFAAESQSAHDTLPAEKDAIDFAAQLKEDISPFISVLPLPIPEMYGGSLSPEEQAALKPLAKYLDFGLHPAKVTETDSPALRLDDQVQLLGRVGQNDRIASAQSLVVQISSQLEAGKIGFVEQRFLLNKAATTCASLGDRSSAALFASALVEAQLVIT